MHCILSPRILRCQLRQNGNLISPTSLVRLASTKVKEDEWLPAPAAKRCDAELDPQIAQSFEEGMKARKHPGRRFLPCVSLPASLEDAAHKAIEKYRGRQFVADVEYRKRHWHHREIPPEEEDFRERKKQIRDMLDRRELRKDINWETMDEAERQRMEAEREDLEEMLLKRYSNIWRPIDYNEYESAVYMSARLPENYACLRAVFHNIKKNVPEFAPRTVFDFGSGCGTVGWAVEETWGENCVSEYFCVDASQEQHELNRFLLEESRIPHRQKRLDTLFTRQYLPVSHTVKFDLVVSAFSLLEQPNRRSRINIIENLWHKTQDMLVIVEHGTEDGFGAVLEARNLILQIGGLKLTQMFRPTEEDDLVLESETTTGHVVAPCSHDLTCPRQQSYGPLLCHFDIAYEPFNYGQQRSAFVPRKEPYSYIVLRKGPRVYSEDKPYMSWPRIVQPVLKRNHHVICRTCCPDAKIGELRLSKAKTDKKLYKCVKVSEWGDYLPATLTEMSFDEEKMQRKKELRERRKEAKAEKKKGDLFN